jgi:hypothetical protein
LTPDSRNSTIASLTANSHTWLISDNKSKELLMNTLNPYDRNIERNPMKLPRKLLILKIRLLKA